MIFLARYLITRRNLRTVKPAKWFSGINSISFFSCFVHLVPEASEQGKFYSRQWEILPETLRNSGKRLNWIHHFIPNPVIPNDKKGVRIMRRMNHNTETKEIHSFLDSWLTTSIVVKASIQWIKYAIKIWLMKMKILPIMYPCTMECKFGNFAMCPVQTKLLRITPMIDTK